MEIVISLEKVALKLRLNQAKIAVEESFMKEEQV